MELQGLQEALKVEIQCHQDGELKRQLHTERQTRITATLTDKQNQTLCKGLNELQNGQKLSVVRSSPKSPLSLIGQSQTGISVSMVTAHINNNSVNNNNNSPINLQNRDMPPSQMLGTLSALPLKVPQVSSSLQRLALIPQVRPKSVIPDSLPHAHSANNSINPNPNANTASAPHPDPMLKPVSIVSIGSGSGSGSPLLHSNNNSNHSNISNSNISNSNISTSAVSISNISTIHNNRATLAGAVSPRNQMQIQTQVQEEQQLPTSLPTSLLHTHANSAISTHTLANSAISTHTHANSAISTHTHVNSAISTHTHANSAISTHTLASSAIHNNRATLTVAAVSPRSQTQVQQIVQEEQQLPTSLLHTHANSAISTQTHANSAISTHTLANSAISISNISSQKQHSIGISKSGSGRSGRSGSGSDDDVTAEGAESTATVLHASANAGLASQGQGVAFAIIASASPANKAVNEALKVIIIQPQVPSNSESSSEVFENEENPKSPSVKKEEDPEKIAFMVSLGLVTTEHLEEIQTKRQERKRRSTANPAYSGLFEPERKRLASHYLNSSLFLSARDTEDFCWKDDLEHDEVCAVCKDEGELQLCHNCPRAFHPNCLHPPLKTPPRGAWYCPKCQKKVLNKENMSWPQNFVQSYVTHKTVRQEEKRRLLRRNNELKNECSHLEEQDKRLNDTLKQCMELRERLLCRQRETQLSLDRLKTLISLVQSDRLITVTMTTTNTTTNNTHNWINKPAASNANNNANANASGNNNNVSAAAVTVTNSNNTQEIIILKKTTHTDDINS